VLAIDILPSFSNGRHSHVQEIRTSALRKMADNNLNSGLKRDYGSKTRERKNSDTKDRSFDVTSALSLLVMLSCRGICIPPNGRAIPSCRINVWIC
jgi:hypothetical protein